MHILLCFDNSKFMNLDQSDSLLFNLKNSKNLNESHDHAPSTRLHEDKDPKSELAV